MSATFILEITGNAGIVKIHRDDLLIFKPGTSLLQYVYKTSYARFFAALSNAKKTGGTAPHEINFIISETETPAFFICMHQHNQQQFIAGSSSPAALDDCWNQFTNNPDISTQGDSFFSLTPTSYAKYNKALNELSKVNNEMTTLQRELNQKNKLLETANADLESFSFAVSHDLHAPVRGIIGFAELLEKKTKGRLEPETEKILGYIHENAIRMRELIKDLLNFSKLSKQSLEHKPVCSEKLVEEVVRDVMQLNTGRNIQWNIHDLADTEGDEKMLYQVWINFISNAVKYSQKRELAIIEISSTTTKEETVFYVKDNGAGFNEKYKAKLFQVFQRLHNYSDFEGTGIGLANVHKIVTKHGGRVWAEGEVDKGASFYFSMPVKTKSNL